MTDLANRTRTLIALHTAPRIQTLVDVWDVASEQVVAAAPETTALATASFGCKDGDHIPLELHLDTVHRIVDAVDLPVSMDFEAGYGIPAKRHAEPSPPVWSAATSMTS